MANLANRAGRSSRSDFPAGSIAVVGMAGRFPAAPSVAELWRLLDQEREATRWLGDEELLAAGVGPAMLGDPHYVRAGLILPDMEMFDAGFFGFSPREAAILDPQHRHFLECAWEALEDAGHVPERFPGSIGVFAGCGMQAYLAYNLLSNPELLESVGLFLLRHTGNDKDFLPTRVSYLLNLQGPSVAVQTACSTSLVAIHLACQNLLDGGCDMALAGGVSIELPHRRGYRFADGEILSPDGHCRAFDADAKGTLFGSGAGVVVLRRLEDALESGDNIHLVIRGSAINNDGAQKAGYLAPSVDGQARAAAEALAVAEVEPASVSYIEAHGTGTAVGDPIELAALAEAYGAGGNAAPCGIGSIKTNIGHLDTAAGVASLIKVALAMRHGKLPASLNFRRPNPRFDFARSRFQVVDRGRPWPRDGLPRRAAVNSIGVGGTNAHAIVEEPPPRIAMPAAQDWQLLPLSARSASALARLCEKWGRFAAESPADLTVADAAYTCEVGRRAFDHRCAVVARDLAGLRAALDDCLAITGQRAPEHRVVFMFPGGGAQHPGAARELYERVPAFRDAVEECFRVMPAAVPTDLRCLMFEHAADDTEAAAALEQPVRALTALFVLEYALTALWRAWGVAPDAVIGHSAGEYAAAVAAGVMSLPDALSVVVLRGQIFERAAPGGMLSVQMPEAELRELIAGELDIAAVNAPDLCVVSGPVPDLDALESRLAAQEVETRRVRINVAGHSRLLDPHLARFAAGVRKVGLTAPQLPFLSTLTGRRASADELTQSDYWVRQLRQTVRFADGLAAALDRDGVVLLEVGPGQVLAALARLAKAGSRPLAVIPSCRKADEPGSDLTFALAAAGRLWTRGQELDWQRLRGEGGFRRISLPTYAFERQRHWIEPGRAPSPAVAVAEAPGIARQAGLDAWFQVSEWRPTPLAPAATDRARPCLVFAGAVPLGATLATFLAARGTACRVVRPGETFGRSAQGDWTIDPAQPEDYARLLAELETEGFQPEGIFYLWALDAARPSAEAPAAVQRQIFEPLFHLCQALQQQESGLPLHLVVATAGTMALPDRAVTHPERATLLGPCRAAAREIPGVSAQLIDVDGADAEALVAEFDARARDEIVAHRDGVRWVQDARPMPPATPDRLASRLVDGGVYVITGGLGGIALELARFLAAEVHGRLTLVSRRAPPAPADWPTLAPGAEVLCLQADVADGNEMRRALEQVRQRFGRINGVFHAAGVLDDAPLGLKTAADTRRVMAPKVAGGAALDRLLPLGSIDLFAVFSSVSVHLGNPGQVDYIAANAFLDALAVSRPDGLAIDWGIWSDVGMAARRYAKPTPFAGVPVHPLLGAELSRSDRELRFEVALDAQATWVLQEHVVAGRPVLPGMAYLEMARAAMAVLRRQPIEITNLSILAPLSFAPGEARLVETSLAANQDGFDVAIRSRSLAKPAGSGPWTTHAQAKARFAAAAAGTVPAWAAQAIDGLGAREEWPAPVQAGTVAFGPRWRNLSAQRLGAEGGVAEVELPASFAGDLAVYGLHPAMADMAATFGLALLERQRRDGMVFMPLSVERVRLAAAFPPRLRSVCRLRQTVADGLVTFDVACTDQDGRLVASFEGFSLRRAEAGAVASPAPSTGSAAPSLVEQMLAAGIRAADAPALFRRVLAQPRRQVVVSSIALAELRQLLAQDGRKATAPKRAATPARTEAYASEIEAGIAGFWVELLGVPAVGPADEFFALGGHSLAAVRLFAKIRKRFGVDLPLASLFEARTLRQLAELVASKGGAPPAPAPKPVAAATPPVPVAAAPRDARHWNPLVTINRGDGGRPPLFCVHGGGGNVLIFHDLSRSLGRDQPLYGLQALGIDGRQRPLASVEEMAASYLAAIRTAQPSGPYFLAGYSGGGVVAYEMSRRLAQDGQRVALLVMFDTVSPPLANHQPSMLERLLGVRRLTLEYVMRGSRRRFTRGMKWVLDRQHPPSAALALDDPSELEAKRKLVRRHLERGEAIPEDLREIHLYDSFMAAQRSYQPDRAAVPLLLFRAAEQEAPFLGEPMLGWDRVVTEPIEVHRIECDHLSMMTRANVEIMCRIVRQRLDDASRQADAVSLRPGHDAAAAWRPPAEVASTD